MREFVDLYKKKNLSKKYLRLDCGGIDRPRHQRARYATSCVFIMRLLEGSYHKNGVGIPSIVEISGESSGKEVERKNGTRTIAAGTYPNKGRL